MIKFGEVSSELQKNNLEDTNTYREIKPQEALSKESADDYWNNLFENEVDVPETDENLLFDVFDRSEDEFDFDFEISDDIIELIQKIKSFEWSYLDEAEKTDVIESLSKKISELLELEVQPNLSYFDDDEKGCGAYNNATNSIELNRNLLLDPDELIDTIAHELRHAYQHQKAMNPGSLLDMLYRVNFDNYISPVCLGDGKFLFFADYYDQLVEVEARAFAKQFNKMEAAA